MSSQENKSDGLQTSAADEPVGGSGKVLKYGSLVVLTLQNAFIILLMRYTRTRDGALYMSTTTVVMAELFKCITCLIILFIQEGDIMKFCKYMYDNTIGNPVDWVKISIPSIIYTLQNNCLFIAVSNLDAATFQVTYQLKILVTAIFSVLMLGRTLSRLQWVALMLLFAGVTIVQIQPHDLQENTAENGSSSQSKLKGLLAVSAGCLMSGFASVYFEKILKGTKQSLMLRNVQLGSIGCIFGLITMEVKDGPQVNHLGFFYGYDWVVWLVVCVHSFGGLMVALVVKYADNILKGFATSTAIIISTIIGVYFFNFRISAQFIFGTFLVLIAVFMYSKYVPHSPEPSIPRSREEKVRSLV